MRNAICSILFLLLTSILISCQKEKTVEQQMEEALHWTYEYPNVLSEKMDLSLLYSYNRDHEIFSLFSVGLLEEASLDDGYVPNKTFEALFHSEMKQNKVNVVLGEREFLRITSISPISDFEGTVKWETVLKRITPIGFLYGRNKGDTLKYEGIYKKDEVRGYTINGLTTPQIHNITPTEVPYFKNNPKGFQKPAIGSDVQEAFTGRWMLSYAEGSFAESLNNGRIDMQIKKKNGPVFEIIADYKVIGNHSREKYFATIEDDKLVGYSKEPNLVFKKALSCEVGKNGGLIIIQEWNPKTKLIFVDPNSMAG